MSFLFAYLIKFSISIAAVYLFYRLVLRKLTFYNWNRWYLMGYTFLSFFIAAINITPLLQRSELADNKTIQSVPYLDLTGNEASVNNITLNTGSILSAWDWTLLILATGTVILFLRLFIQWLSFLQVRSKAELLSGQGMRIYQVDGNIIPFSFGNSIFINKKLHTDEELQEIIRHEFVHVKQRHSIDIIWSELLCIINWYNPFIWMLRHAVRQNLEFIADHKVVSHGIDRREYQYLLLKVIGNNHFSIASKFNFSSLKKRIAMMNKMKSAGVHLVKFLFILPFVAVLLVAFRNGRNVQPQLKDLLEQPILKPGYILAASIDTVPRVSTANSKGYLIDIIGVEGECTVVIKDKQGKEIERVLLNKWNEDQKYEEMYGEILSPPPAVPVVPAVPVKPGDPVSPVVPVVPAKPGEPVPPIAPVAPVLPIECPVKGNLITPVAMTNGEGINLAGISREYEITDKKAELKLLDGTIEKYDLTNKKEKIAFEKKYGKIVHVNTNVNTSTNANVKTIISSNVNNNINTNVDAVISIPSPETSTFSNPVTAVAPVAIGYNEYTTVADVTPRPGVTATTVADPYSYVISGKEDIVITITKHTTRQELDKFITDMKAKGVELDLDDIEYNEKGKLVNISGNMRSGGSHSNFFANDFEKIILAMIKKGDQVYFKVSVRGKEVI